MTQRELIVSVCREIVRMDNWCAELRQRETYAPGRVNPGEVKLAETRLDSAIERLLDVVPE